MFRNNIFTVLLFSSLCASATTAGAEVIFLETFESSDMTTTNEAGFAWGGLNRTSIVTRDAACSTPGDNVVLWNGRAICTVLSASDPRDWTAKVGDNSLRFRYAAGEYWTEQRYDFGKGYPETWVSYWIRVPTNYYRGSGTNNKWFDILMAPMSQYEDSTVSRIEMQDWASNTAGAMVLNIQFRNGSDGKFKSSDRYPDFVTPADAGKWMHIIYQLKSSSNNTATDGILRMYRRWENEGNYTLINELINLNVGIGAGSVSAGYLGWGAGYIMGYANSAYAKDTEWLLDNFTVSNTSLFPNLPNPPNHVTGTVK